MKQICITAILVLALTYTVMATVVIDYEDAVQLASTNHTADAIATIEALQEDLRDELRRIQHGDWTRERMAPLFAELELLQIGMFEMYHTNQHLQQLIDNTLENMEDSLENIGTAMASTLLNMLAVQNIGGSMSMAQNRINSIFNEIMDLQDGATARELTTTIQESIQALDRQIEVLHLQQAEANIGRENMLRTLIVAIAEVEATIAIAELNLSSAIENLRQTNIRHYFGRGTAHSVALAEREVLIMEVALLQQNANLQNAVNSLNYLLGQPLSQQTVINFDLTSATEPADLAYIITHAPEIRYLTMYVTDAREAVRQGRTADRETREALQEAYEEVLLNLNNRKQTMEAAMLRGFNTLAGLKLQYEIQSIAIAQAVENYDIARINFSQGRITPHQLNQVYTAISHEALTLEAIYRQMWILEFRLYHPWLLH